jgi:hypothetical protein
LKDHPDIPPMRRYLDHGLPRDAHIAARQLLEAREDFQQGRLAGSRGPQQRDEFAGLDVE